MVECIPRADLCVCVCVFVWGGGGGGIWRDSQWGPLMLNPGRVRLVDIGCVAIKFT